MMPYILIDTCILNKLISPKELSYLLSTLEPLVQEGHVKLLVPNVLLEEWEKHRETTAKEKINKFFKDQNTQAHIKKLIDPEGGLILEETIAEAKAKLYSQIANIDFLLNEYGLKIDETQGVKNLIFEQQKLKKAPFHIKGKDSHNDARLIFSSLDYLKTNDIDCLVFVSSNPEDFAENNGSSLVIHSDIQKLFPTIEIKYFDHFHPAYKYIVEQCNIPKDKQTEPYRKKKLNRIPVDRSKPIIEQIHQYFSAQFEYIDVLPKELFLEQYPFLIDERNLYARRPYTLITDNEELYNLLTSAKVENGVLVCPENSSLSEVDRDKLFHILKRLRANLVYFISIREDESTQLIFEDSDKDCECLVCLFQKLRFPELFNKLNRPINSSESLQEAYILYKLGHYYESGKVFTSILQSHTEKSTLTFIISNNLRRLASIIDFRYWKDQQAQALSRELETLHIEEILSDCNAPQNSKLLDYIYYSEFSDKAYAKMSGLVNKIKDLYYSKSSGTNDNTRQLIEEYVTLVQFLDKNHIVFDLYSDFSSLTSLFTEGIIASYASKPKLGGKLLFFDDTLLKLLLSHGSHEEIRKLMRRYKITDIEYRPNAKPSLSFYCSFIKMLQSYPDLSQSEFLKNSKENHFWNDFASLVNNGITICSYLNVTRSDIETIASVILTYAKTEKHQHYHSFNQVIDLFLTRHSSSLSESLLLDFLKLTLMKDSMHDESLLETLVDEFERRNIRIELSTEEYNSFKETFLFNETTTHEGHKWRLVGYVYSLLENEEFRNELSTIISQQLQEKFDTRKFYLACAFNMISPNDYYLEQYENHIYAVVKKGPHHNIFSDKDYFTDHRLDEFYNFCFKYDLPIEKNIMDEIGNLGEYYIWLSNIDKYDYSKFNYKWLFNHFTLYYKRRYRQSDILKKHVLSIIREKNDPDLDRIFINIWDLVED